MSSFRPSYKVCPGDRLEVEVVQPDGGGALVVGKSMRCRWRVRNADRGL
jgi:hypothetical protein